MKPNSREVREDVIRLQELLANRERIEGDSQEHLRKKLRRRLEKVKAGRLVMACSCVPCLEAHILADPSRLCLTGYDTVCRYSEP